MKIALLIGTVVLALVLVSGGVFALLRYPLNTPPATPAAPPTRVVVTTSAQSQADVIVCLRYTGYQPDPRVQGEDLEYQYQLLNRGSAQAIVTSIHIGVFGPNVKSGIIIPTNLDTLPGLKYPVPGKTLTGLITNPIYVGAVTERSFQYAKSWVIWTTGRSQQFRHVNNGTEWTNDSAC